MTLDEAILAAVTPMLRPPTFHDVHYLVSRTVGDRFKAGQIHDRMIELIRDRTLAYAAGYLVLQVPPLPPEQAACRRRTDQEEQALAQRRQQREKS